MPPKRPITVEREQVLWNTNSWLPENFGEPDWVYANLSDYFIRMSLYNPQLTMYGHADTLSDEFLSGYSDYWQLYGIYEMKGTPEQILDLVLVKLVSMASMDRWGSKLVIITKLTKEWKMISSVVASLRSRGCRVYLAVPELETGKRDFGITLGKEEEVRSRVPVWICPHLFDQKPGHQFRMLRPECSIELPPPDPHTTSFSMSRNDTCVFWDVQDYPLPVGLQVRMFYENIVSAVPTCGKLYIYAYVTNDQFYDYDEDAAFITTVVRNAPQGKFERLAKMTRDFLLWSMDNQCPGGPNLLLISKLLQEDDTLGIHCILSNLVYAGHNVLLALPREKVPLPVVPISGVISPVPFLPWEDLSETLGKRKSREENTASHD